MHPMASLLSTTLNVTARLAPGLAGPPAFALFVRPLGRARLKPREAEVMARAERGRMDVRGTAVTTYRWGRGTGPFSSSTGGPRAPHGSPASSRPCGPRAAP